MIYTPKKEDVSVCGNKQCNETYKQRSNKKFCSLKCKNNNNYTPKESDLLDFSESDNKAVSDNINPSHYKGEVECIDAIKASMSLEAFKGYLKGNVMKYTWRDKENKKEDLDKAIWYINKYKEQL